MSEELLPTPHNAYAGLPTDSHLRQNPAKGVATHNSTNDVASHDGIVSDNSTNGIFTTGRATTDEDSVDETSQSDGSVSPYEPGKRGFDASVNSTRGFPADDSSMNNLLELSVRSVSSSPSWTRLVTVEPMMFLFTLALTFTFPVQTTLYLVHTCRGVLGYNESTCSMLEGSSNTELEALVQPAANRYVMWSTLVETCLPAALTLFIGPWSDRHGRKTFLLLPIIGYMLKYAMCLVFSLYPALPPAYLLLASVPVSLGGGFVSIISLCYCCITDVTTEQQRGFRMGMLEACYFTALMLATATSTYLFSAGGYIAVYGTSVALCAAAFLYGLLCVTETVRDVEDCRSKCVGSLLDWGLVRSMLATCCKKRGYGRRAVIFLVVAALATAVLAMEGETSVVFMFTRSKFGWDMKHFTTFGSVSILLQIAGTVVGVTVLSSWLGIPDAPLAMTSFGLKVATSLIHAWSPHAWYLYVGAGVGMFGAVTGPLCRAIVSKAVDHEDVGKVFSLLSVAEAVTPLASAPLYTLVYNVSLLGFPGAFFLLSGAIYLLDFALLVAVAVISRLHPAPQYALLSPE